MVDPVPKVGKAGVDYIGVGVGALIYNDADQILLTLRGPKARNERGKWEIPGGSVEFGETFAQAIQREVHEELGIEVEVQQLLHLADHLIPEEHQHWVSPTFICRITSGVPAIKEPEKCAQIGWFSLDEAKKLPLSLVTQQDIEVIRKKSRG